MITHTEDGAEAFADMTVNLPGYSLDPGDCLLYTSKVKNHLLRIGKFREDEIHMLPIMGMEEPWRYRNKAQFCLLYTSRCV